MSDAFTASGLIVPDAFGAGSEGSGPLPSNPQDLGFPRGRPLEGMTGTVVNDSDLPDDAVMQMTNDHFVHNASLAWGRPSNFQLYNQRQGSLLARSEYRTPGNVFDEIRLARDLAEHDDDVAAVMRELLALAFGEGMEHTHSDERSLAVFDQVAKEANLDRALVEMYREYLIASQFTTAMLFTRQEIEFTPRGASRSATTMANTPVIGVLHSEDVRVLGTDMFGTGILAYDPPDERQREWLAEYFNPSTSVGRKAEMGRQDRASANLFTGVVEVDQFEATDDRPWSWATTGQLFLLNPALCARTAMPKGAWKYPKPMLTANFSLLEAKRLLNVMDYALLQGGSNFIVVAKKGTDQRPAQAAEVENLMQVVRQASKSGVIVGDHRLTFEIITPKLDELLNASKRRLLGRKIAARMMGLAERGDSGDGNEGESSDVEILSRVVMSDRNSIRRHVENRVYPQVVKRNRKLLTKGPAGIWFPKVVLQGLQYFTDLVLKLRDRGDIARGTAVAAAGFDWDTEVAKRKNELASGDDKVMVPGEVPHSSPEAGPQDNNEGRPPGAKDGSKPDPAAPRKTITKNPGETIKAWWDEELGEIVRIGDVTYAILEEYADTKYEGRVTALEREAIEGGVPITRGGIAVVPVNQHVSCADDLVAIGLTEDKSLRVVIGYRETDQAIVARALIFRDSVYDLASVEQRVANWGYGVHQMPTSQPQLPPGEEQGKAPEVHLHLPSDEKGERVFLKDEDGNIIGVGPKPSEEE